MTDTIPNLPPVDRSSPGTMACALIGASAGLVDSAVFWALACGFLLTYQMDGFASAPVIGRWLWSVVPSMTVGAAMGGAGAGAIVLSRVGGWRLACLGLAAGVLWAGLVALMFCVIMAGGVFAPGVTTENLVAILLLVGGVILLWPRLLGDLAAAAVYRGAMLAYQRGSVR